MRSVLNITQFYRRDLIPIALKHGKIQRECYEARFKISDVSEQPLRTSTEGGRMRAAISQQRTKLDSIIAMWQSDIDHRS